MDDPRAQRTLVKSPPELWAEISDAGALAGHLGAFGEIRITRLEPETTVAWEGDRARGTVELEPSGWGTRVTLTAQMADAVEPSAAEEPEGPAESPPPAEEPDAAVADAAPEPPRRRGLLWRLLNRRRRDEPAPARPAPPAAEQVDADAEGALPARAPEPEPEPAAPAPGARAPEPEPEPETPSGTTQPASLDAGRAEEILVRVLDDLGAARHRPFSRG